MGEGEDRLQLLHQWLACDEGAGDQLWSGPGGLFDEYRVKGKEWGLQYLGKLWRRGVRIDHEQYLAFKEYEMEVLAADQLADIHDRVKPPEANPVERETKSKEKGKKPKDFPTLDDFHAYISKSLRQGIKDLIKEYLGLDNALVESLDEPLPERGEKTEGEERTLGETIATVEETPEVTVIAEERRRLAADLLRGFQDYLARRRPPVPALRCYFDTMVEAHKVGRDDIPLEAVAEEIIAFLEAPPWEHHPEIKRYFESKGANESTYNSYNRRVRQEWRVFREGRGKALYQRYEETR